MILQKITCTDGKLSVPDNPIVIVIKGDGIGRTINGVLGVTDSALKTLDAAVEKSHNGKRKIYWKEALAGEVARETFHPELSEEAYQKHSPEEQQKFYLPQQTVDLIKAYQVALKGPLGTPSAGGFRSINVALRKIFDLYACVRPIKHFPGVPSPNINAPGLDLVIFRENTEDVYRGIEFQAGSEKARKLQNFLREELGADLDPHIDYGLGVKPMSAFGTKRLVRKAIQHALEKSYNKVTVVHKGNIMKYTEGAFLQWGTEVAGEEFPQVIFEEELWEKYQGKIPEGKIMFGSRIADAMLQFLQQSPRDFGVLACPNLNGDYLSDDIAALVGGLGLAPGANINYETGMAVFEATHGTWPKATGQDRANPSSVILSGAMMLEYFGWNEAAELVRKGVTQALIGAAEAAARKEKVLPVTEDLAAQFPGYTLNDGIKCSEYTQRVIEGFE